MIYLDNAATTRALPAVAEKMTYMLTEQYGNPASVSIMGLEVDKEIRHASQILARGIHCKEEEVFFTSGGTEGDNWAIFGTAEGYQRHGKHFITTQIEHPAVKNPMKALEEKGCEVTWLSVDSKGHILLEELAAAIRPDTVLVSIILVNNETGVVQDGVAIGKLIKEKNPQTLFHVDAVQAFGKYPVDVEKMKIDLLTMSGHKIHGPKGVGMLYMRKGTKVKPFILGGGQQKGQRAGTENGPAVAALGVAAEEAFGHMQESIAHVSALKKALAEGILAMPNTKINGDGLDEASPYVLNVTFEGLRSEVLLHDLESKGIIVSAGSACDSKKKVGSPVLMAMGMPFSEIEGAVRFSFSRYNTMEEIETCLLALEKSVPFLRKYNR
ncbi:cysteine desulfurase family protein [Anaerotignum sp.]|uniref:cysteine desulfurase family protein n=1 Tax=Anaerotignum sp. TaxID=2039241 RepID=UPI002898D470|nr:cysteine desulfurase family protein [Anaerotignum sp.]